MSHTLISAQGLTFLNAVWNRHHTNANVILNGLNMLEMLLLLDTIDEDDLERLDSHLSSAPVSRPRCHYALQIMSESSLPSSAPADLPSDQVNAARQFLATRWQPRFSPTISRDPTNTLPRANPSAARLTNADFEKAGAELGVEAAAVHAVAHTEEGPTGGFGPDGRPTIRYELHVFSDKTAHAYDKLYPYVSQRTLALSRPFHEGGAVREWSNMYAAMMLRKEREKALESASWGRFQVMGLQYAFCGYASIDAFVADMHVSEARHLHVFLAYVRKAGLIGALKAKNWDAFALGYNGKAYKTNNYQIHMAQNYARYSRK